MSATVKKKRIEDKLESPWRKLQRTVDAVKAPSSDSGKLTDSSADLFSQEFIVSSTVNMLDSPMRTPKPKYGDRFIPSRVGNAWSLTYEASPESLTPRSLNKISTSNLPRTSTRTDENDNNNDNIYSCLLKNESLGYRYKCRADVENSTNVKPSACRRLFHYDSTSRLNLNNEPQSPYSLSPLSSSSIDLLKSPQKATRRISKLPYKVLDAPELQDDFYLNLVDWSSNNYLGVGLGHCVYLWSATTSEVTRLCDLSTQDDSVTSVSWNERGSTIAVGTHSGQVQLWDVATSKKIQTLMGHTARVGALAWNGDLLSSGSRDRFINQRDIRVHRSGSRVERSLVAHRQEVCGLKWSPDKQYLASGGNDNRLYVWDLSSLTPVQCYSDHVAAVKAIAWSPHHHGLLCSGGGTADRCIRFWNTLTGQAMQCIDTGSQVCNLAWSKHSHELVSTHGYSLNQIILWKFPAMEPVVKLTGHTYRVLFLAMSPDGRSIVTGAGDETLRFWNVFSKNNANRNIKSLLSLGSGIR